MLYYTVGLPRSGKSTLCDQWVHRTVRILNNEFVQLDRQEVNVSPQRVIVCADDIRIALHGQRYQVEAEEFVHSIKHTMIRAYLARGFDVLVDGTHTTLNSAQKLFDISSEYQTTLMQVKVFTSVELCKERAKSTNQEDLIPVIDRMNEQLRERGVFCRE